MIPYGRDYDGGDDGLLDRRTLAQQRADELELGALSFSVQSRPDSSLVDTSSLADLYTPIDWRELWSTTSPDPDWLVPDVLERGRLHAIYAPKKHRKSLLTLVMVAELATGRSLLGRPNPHQRRQRVLYIDLENARGDIRERLDNAGYGPEDLESLTYLSFPPLPGLDSPTGAAHLMALADRHHPDLLVLDTTSRVVTGKENDADTFRALYRCALAPIKAKGVAVLRLDHAGKDIALGQRGSSAKGDDLDTAWLVTIRDDTRITLRLDFQRTNHHPETVELVQRSSPLQFVRIDSAADRPEVTALLAELDRLGVPFNAGRPTAAKALRQNKVRFSDAILTEAIKIRKSCAEDQRTAHLDDDHSEIHNGCAEDQKQADVSAGERCAAQPAHSSHSDGGSSSGGAVRDLAVSRSAQPIAQRTPGLSANRAAPFGAVADEPSQTPEPGFGEASEADTPSPASKPLGSCDRCGAAPSRINSYGRRVCDACSGRSLNAPAPATAVCPQCARELNVGRCLQCDPILAAAKLAVDVFGAVPIDDSIDPELWAVIASGYDK